MIIHFLLPFLHLTSAQNFEDYEDADYVVERYTRKPEPQNGTQILLQSPQLQSQLNAFVLQTIPNITSPTFGRGPTSSPDPCLRECSTDPKTREICKFRFILKHTYVMSEKCGDCPKNLGDCFRTGCILADGNRRVVDTANEMMPGPAIRVCEGDTVLVEVHNYLMQDATIHWHGIHMKKTPFMDGVPMVTQCPIPAKSSMKYEFDVPIGGTYFWHSHAGLQRGDGLYGTLIVRKAPEKEAHGPENGKLYDFDLPEHEMVIMDWQHRETLSVLVGFQYATQDFRPTNVLVNGKGWPRGVFNQTNATDIMKLPLQEIEIEQGKAYRMRLVSNGLMSCPLEMSIEGHVMQVISSDGFDIAPVTVDSLVLYAGERWDIVVQGNQPVGSYWIKFRGLNVCAASSSQVYQVAVLKYDGASNSMPKNFIKSWYEAGPSPGGKQLNPLNLGPGKRNQFITVAEVASLKDDDPEIVTRRIPDHKFYLSYDFNRIDNKPLDPLSHEHRAGHVVNIDGKLYTPQLNFISHEMPRAPPLTQRDAIPFMDMCSYQNGTLLMNGKTMTKNCEHDYCGCTHLLKVKRDSIVELILIDKGETMNANHPFHLHGHSFRVVGLERLGLSTTVEAVQELDQKNMLIRRRTSGPIKDTVTVPDGGYTIVRFRADNPGFWYMHCHIEFHSEVGMGLIFQVGETSEMLTAPANVLKCGDYPVPPPPTTTTRKTTRRTTTKKPAAFPPITTTMSTTTTTTKTPPTCLALGATCPSPSKKFNPSCCSGFCFSWGSYDPTGHCEEHRDYTDNMS